MSLTALLVLPCWPAPAASPILTVAPPDKLVIRRGATAEAKIELVLGEGFHMNSNKPDESYLIPLKLTWSTGPVEAGETVYPAPRHEKYEFSDKPLSVYTSNVELVTKFKARADAPDGPAVISGKLRYQACNDRACFPPKTLDVTLPVQVR